MVMAIPGKQQYYVSFWRRAVGGGEVASVASVWKPHGTDVSSITPDEWMAEVNRIGPVRRWPGEKRFIRVEPRIDRHGLRSDGW